MREARQRGEVLEIVARPCERRTTAQNGYDWRLAQAIAEHTSTGKAEVHRYLKERFTPGALRTESTRHMSKRTSGYLAAVEAFAHEKGARLQGRDEQSP